MSKYRVELISSVPGLPGGASAEITDTYGRLFDSLEEARALTLKAMGLPPAAHTGQIVEVSTGAVVWKTGRGAR